MPELETSPETAGPFPLDHAGRLDLRSQHLHFVGIGGCGMSGLARIARAQGAACSGSDMQPSPVTESLISDEVAVVYEQTAEALPEAATALVISAAIPADHPEVAEAGRRGLPVIKYAQLLGQLMRGRTGVAIAGTHGKSTTTAILAHILIQAGLDPNFILGAQCAQIGGGSRTSSTGSDVLIAEACEYDRSFHNFFPTHALILNVEADHLDLYAGIEEIVEAFAVFAQRLPQADESGSLLVQHEMPCRMDITAKLNGRIETIGFAPQADWHIEFLPLATEDGRGTQVRLHRQGVPVATWRSPMPGEHMAYNAAAAAVTAYRLGADWPTIEAAITTFAGLGRRMERLGQRALEDGKPPITVLDDYGHHPTEVDTTLRALRQYYQPKRLICVFQPHQHSRTRFLMDQFAVSFSAADQVIVPEIYFVRDSEQERQAVTAEDLVARLRERDVDAQHLHPFSQIVDHLRATTQPGDLIVTMGAGNVNQIAHAYLAADA